VVFVVEGEEESGSGNLEPFLRAHRDNLRCDVAVISDSGMIAPGVPTLLYGMRGVVCMEIRLKGPSSDLHSGIFGGLVANPAIVLARLIGELQTDDGHITIPGFYDRVREIEDWERQLWQQLPTTEQDWLKLTGAPKLTGESGYSGLERIWARPSMDVNGSLSGYTGEGPKTIVPSESRAKISFRLVPDQNPDEIRNLITEFIRHKCPDSVRLEIVNHHQGPPYMIRTDSPYVLAAKRALETTFGKSTAMIRGGGTLPVAQVIKEVLGVDTLLVGLEWMDCRVHSPNENFPIENLSLGVALNQNLLIELAAL
jgi:acetylornithine deacetylase/succinyl-diaminopimelate desuccinylase-like protein